MTNDTIRPARILIADDDALVRLIARAVVERAGMIPFEASDGPETLARVSSEKFDLILLDLDLPVISGLDILRKLRADDATKDLPVLVVTGAEGREIEEALALGATGIFPKPIAAEGLLKRLREVAR
jgi:CheY-like chemotaxis protein